MAFNAITHHSRHSPLRCRWRKSIIWMCVDFKCTESGHTYGKAFGLIKIPAKSPIGKRAPTANVVLGLTHMSQRFIRMTVCLSFDTRACTHIIPAGRYIYVFPAKFDDAVVPCSTSNNHIPHHHVEFTRRTWSKREGETNRSEQCFPLPVSLHAQRTHVHSKFLFPSEFCVVAHTHSLNPWPNWSVIKRDPNGEWDTNQYFRHRRPDSLGFTYTSRSFLTRLTCFQHQQQQQYQPLKLFIAESMNKFTKKIHYISLIELIVLPINPTIKC